MEEHQLTQDEFHSKLYVVSLIATLFAAHMNHELFEGIDYFLLRPGTVPEIESLDQIVDPTWTIARKAFVLLMFGTTGIMGASCLGAITKRFGALSMALTSTARKATTLFLSFALFNSKCTSEHVVGVSLFMSGLMMKTLSKRKTAQSTQTAGEKPDEGTRSSGQVGGKMKRYFTYILGVLPFVSSRFSQDPADKAILLRHRSSAGMEFGLRTD